MTFKLKSKHLNLSIDIKDWIVKLMVDHLQKVRRVIHCMTTSGTTSHNEWQRLTTYDKEWQRSTMYDPR